MRFDVKRQGLAVVLALGIAILCGVLAGLLGRGRFDGRYAVPTQHRETHVVAPPPIASVVPSRPTPPVAAPEAPPPVPLAEDVPDDDDRDRIAAAIARATRKALDRGEPVRWHKAGQRGYIVVSEEQDFPDRTCRNVSATVTGDDGETRSGTHLWCLGDDDEDWQPAQ